MNDFSQSLKNELLRLRENGASDFEPIHSLTNDEYLYLKTETIIRNDKYDEFINIQSGFTNDFFKYISSAYYYLFTNPTKSLENINILLQDFELSSDLNSRVRFWEMDAYFLKGEISKGSELLGLLNEPLLVHSIWKAEALAIYALVHYFINDLDQAAFYHLECSDLLTKKKDSFLQIFNASMALRVSLKKCDPASFDHFSEVLACEIDNNQEKRYSLRVYAYKALIYNQLADHVTAEKYWLLADKLVPDISMKWEVGQFYLWKTVGRILSNDEFSSKLFYQKAHKFLEESGSPLIYLAELELIKVLRPWGTVAQLSKGLMHISKECEKAKAYLKSKIEDPYYFSVRSLFEEGLYYIDEFMNGSQEKKYHSLVISIFKNFSKTGQLQDGIKSSRKTQYFISLLTECRNLNPSSVLAAYKQVFGDVTTSGDNRIINTTHMKDESVENEMLIRFTNKIIESFDSNVDNTNVIMLAHDLKNILNPSLEFIKQGDSRKAFRLIEDGLKFCEDELQQDENHLPLAKITSSLFNKYEKSLRINSFNEKIISSSIDSSKLLRILSNLVENSLQAKATLVTIDVQFDLSS